MNEKLLGIDIGSTTVKLVVYNPISQEIEYSAYQRHNANQRETLMNLLQVLEDQFPQTKFRAAFCGSAGEPYARKTRAFFTQEVVANAIAIKALYPKVRSAIELGGQDAKVIFFRMDEGTGKLVTSDMRMNGSCAGGTGAFIDQIAELLNIKTEDFNSLAEKGNQVYEISGRCGVFAKTDIQPLLNQGVALSDIALSCFHAVAKQTIGGLAQGVNILPPVIFEGGPLTFNSVLIKVFQERLNLRTDQIIIPERPELVVALGAALSTQVLYPEQKNEYIGLVGLLSDQSEPEQTRSEPKTVFFADSQEFELFQQRHRKAWKPLDLPPGSKLQAWLGVDGGSTTTKLVLMTDEGLVADTFYANNQGEPLEVLRRAILDFRKRWRAKGVELEILGVGTTGYAENLFAKALKADYHTVETVAHAEAAKSMEPDVDFILDIGGQDMKAIFIREGIVTGITLNEACSAGCGSFIETYARSLKIPVQEVAPLAFQAQNPSRLGSRCTVFMNSSIITEQKSGKSSADIMAGLCRSVIENVFTKVLRIYNMDQLGKKIVVQGGTFKNDAILRAFEQYSGKQVIRPELPGEMGAWGIALLTRDHVKKLKEKDPNYESSFIGLDEMENFMYRTNPGQICPFCQNHCNRTIVTFNDGTHFVTGHRCEKGEILGDLQDPEVRSKIMETSRKQREVPDLSKVHQDLLTKEWNVKQLSPSKKVKIGLPQALEFWHSLPFWKGLFSSLGFEVVVSRTSSYPLFEKGLKSVPSDTACFPVKLTHGHVQDLIEKKVDVIFMPTLIIMPKENKYAQGGHLCPLIQGYPSVIAQQDEPEAKHGIKLLSPTFIWYNKRQKEKQIIRFLREQFEIPIDLGVRAYHEAEHVNLQFSAQLKAQGRVALDYIQQKSGFGIILAGRPYHSDPLISHNLSSHFTSLGIPVLTLDSLEGLEKVDIRESRMETFNPFHSRMIAAAIYCAENPDLEMAQVVSFGCGHDAIISDEITRILREKSKKEPLILKLDEGENRGPIAIRVKSFVETIRARREKIKGSEPQSQVLEDYSIRFTKEDKKSKTIIIPNLSFAFSSVTKAVIEREGYKVKQMPLADQRAIELGKRYVHNDICFPAQVNIGEALRMLESGDVDPNTTALGLSKNCEDCRAGHYVALARKALDEAGYPQVPIITTGKDVKNIHPGFNLSVWFQIRMAWGLVLIDALETMLHAVRPYERIKGQADQVFRESLDEISISIGRGIKQAKEAMIKAVHRFNAIEVDRSTRKPRVGIIGEILINYHPTANGDVERYLESHGMEIVLPSMTDFFRRSFLVQKWQAKNRLLPNNFMAMAIGGLNDGILEAIGNSVHKIMKNFKFYEGKHELEKVMNHIKGLMPESLLVGEGWLMPAEIIEMAENGVNSFVILSPFGCLPNHVSGRGMVKAIKKRFPHLQILPLDFDPDTSFANVENRLQMLVITARELEKANAWASEAQ
jgi:predicted CoA-substrate-specific enzyme activase